MHPRHRNDVRRDNLRVRPERVVWFGLSMTLTLLAVIAAVGLLPRPSIALAEPVVSATTDDDWTATSLAAVVEPAEQLAPPSPDPVTGSASTQDPGQEPAQEPGQVSGGRPALDPAPPAGSGTGRRVVFDMSAQQVWLVRADESVPRTYPVSGSVYDNLTPGSYAVYSRSESATSFDYESTMRWMVRFTQGANAAIGFHAIPRGTDGEPLQTWQQLGTPQSHGCIRQRPRDAQALWRFAPVGTPVVVVA